MNQTSVTAVGTVITPIQLRHLPNGTPVLNFRIACNERRFDRDANTWIDRDSFFVAVSCWRRLAENTAQSLHSGDPVVVRGRLVTRSYDTADGRRNSVTDLEADVVAPDLTRCTAVVTRIRRAEAAAPFGVAVVPVDGEGSAEGPGSSEQLSDDPWSDQQAPVAEGERELVDAVPAAGH